MVGLNNQYTIYNVIVTYILKSWLQLRESSSDSDESPGSSGWLSISILSSMDGVWIELILWVVEVVEYKDCGDEEDEDDVDKNDKDSEEAEEDAE